MAHWLDDKFRIPGTNLRFGLDGLVGLIPGVGDFATSVASLLIVGAAWRSGAPGGLLVRMVANIGLELVLGTIPVIGDAFDFAWKANRKNLRLLRRWQEATPARD